MTLEFLTTLCSQKKLDRDNGVTDLNKYLSTCCSDKRIELENELFLLISSSSEIPWETKHGCLLGAKALLSVIDLNNEREYAFTMDIKQIARQLLTDIEVRVRLEAGKQQLYPNGQVW